MGVSFPAALVHSYPHSSCVTNAVSSSHICSVDDQLSILTFQLKQLCESLSSKLFHTLHSSPARFTWAQPKVFSLLWMLTWRWGRHRWRFGLSWEWDPKPGCLGLLVLHSICYSIITEEAVSTLTWVIVLLSAVPWSQLGLLEVCDIGAIQQESLLHHRVG